MPKRLVRKTNAPMINDPLPTERVATWRVAWSNSTDRTNQAGHSMPPRQPSGSDGRAEDLLERAALRYLTRRDRTETQVKVYLERLGASPTRVRTLIKQLRSLG